MVVRSAQLCLVLPLTGVETLEVLVVFTVGIRNAVRGADEDRRVAGVPYALNKWNVSIRDYSGALIQVRNVTDHIRDPTVFSSLFAVNPTI